MQQPDWNWFYFDAIGRGMTKEDAEWHADLMMDNLGRAPESYEREEREHG